MIKTGKEIINFFDIQVANNSTLSRTGKTMLMNEALKEVENIRDWPFLLKKVEINFVNRKATLPDDFKRLPQEKRCYIDEVATEIEEFTENEEVSCWMDLRNNVIEVDNDSNEKIKLFYIASLDQLQDSDTSNIQFNPDFSYLIATKMAISHYISEQEEKGRNNYLAEIYEKEKRLIQDMKYYYA